MTKYQIGLLALFAFATGRESGGESAANFRLSTRREMVAPSPRAKALPLNLLSRAAGARVHSFSTEYGSGWEASNLVPSDEQLGADGRAPADLVWSSAANAPFPHTITFDLSMRRWLTTFVFNNVLSDEPDHPGISARLLEVQVGDTPQVMRTIASFELARNSAGQAVQIAPVEARYVTFVIRSNWGHPWYTELGVSHAYDDGTRPATLASTLETHGRADLHGLYFDFGSSALRPESHAVLQELASYAHAHAHEALVIEGHTDDRGATALNDQLSMRRAEAVVSALVQLGVVPTRLRAVGYGSSRPVASNADDYGRAHNRRVMVARDMTGAPPAMP